MAGCSRGRIVELGARLIKEFDVRGGGPQTRAGGLSGGNQQKLVLAREIDRNPRVLIAAQPTRGLDVGAIEFVHRRLVAERDEGRGILLVSLELEEILSLSDRILVIYEGEIVGEFDPTAIRGATRDSHDRRRPRAARLPRERRARQGPAAHDETPEDPSGLGPSVQASLAERYAIAQKAEGILAPVLTALLAFFVGGLVVLVTTGKNPIATYQAIFDGSGLNWLFPWISGAERTTAALNFQQTLLITTPLILTGLAVAFAFRCGMFNIGGQGQYLVGSFFAVWIGSSMSGLNPFVHVVVAIVVAMIAGAAWAGIAGFLKATVGAHEVITTIMLNWIAIWVGQFLFGIGGPLQNCRAVGDSDLGRPSPTVPSCRSSGATPISRACRSGSSSRVAALVVYWVILNRTTLGYGVKAVGFNPEAARYGGINVSRNYFLAMAISGTFAGLAGALDILGWQFHIATSDINASQIGFVGIAVALLGRNTAVGVGLSALLFAALVNGTSTRNLDPSVFQPELASNLTLLIQGLVVLFVGADVIVLTLLRRVRRRKPAAT